MKLFNCPIGTLVEKLPTHIFEGYYCTHLAASIVICTGIYHNLQTSHRTPVTAIIYFLVLTRYDGYLLSVSALIVSGRVLKSFFAYPLNMRYVQYVNRFSEILLIVSSSKSPGFSEIQYINLFPHVSHSLGLAPVSMC